LEDDQRFEQAIRRAGNVVLADAMRAKDIPISSGGSMESGTNIVKLTSMSPFPGQRRAPLSPQDSFKVNQYWTFQRGPAMSPFPIVALQQYGWEGSANRPARQQVNPGYADKLPADIEQARSRGLVA
jgi:hypothetical protein